MTYRYTAVQKVEPTVYVLRYEMTVIGKSRWLLVCLLTLASCAGVVAALRYKSLSQHSSVRRLEALGVTFSLDKKAAPQTSWSRVVFGDRRFDFIKRMKVQGGSLSNRDASRISDFPRLRDVFIEECPDTDAIFGATARVTTIEYVHLHNSKVTQYGIQKLSDIRQLKSLTITNPATQGLDLKPLEDLFNLESLSVSGREINDEVFLSLPPLSTLEFIGCENTSITDKGVKHLPEFTVLQRLAIRASDVSGNGLNDVAKVKKLKYLDLEGCPITDEGLRNLYGATSLEKIRIYATHVSRDGVQSLREKLPHCEIGSDYQQ